MVLILVRVGSGFLKISGPGAVLDFSKIFDPGPVWFPVFDLDQSVLVRGYLRPM